MRFTFKQLGMFIGGLTAVGVADKTIAHADTVIVKSGDTTWDIAKSHNTTVDKIVKDNNLKFGGSLIYPNQKLDINTDESSHKTVNSNYNSANKSFVVSSTSNNSNASNNAYQNNQTSNLATNYTPAYSTNNVPTTAPSYSSPTLVGAEAQAKEWIAARESGGSYSARNGKYIGRYQLDQSYLNGDWSPSNQEKVADNYVKNRYGSWQNAKYFWQTRGWY